MITRRVKFFKNASLANGETFEAGRVYELPGPSAQRWIIRNKAELYLGPWPIPRAEPKWPNPVIKKEEPEEKPQEPSKKVSAKSTKKKRARKDIKKE